MSLFKKLCLVIITLSSSVTAIALLPIALESYFFLQCIKFASGVGQNVRLVEDTLVTVNFCNGGNYKETRNDLNY